MPWQIYLAFSMRLDWAQLVVAAFNRNRERVDPKFQLNLPRVKREGTVSETLASEDDKLRFGGKAKDERHKETK